MSEPPRRLDLPPFTFAEIVRSSVAGLIVLMVLVAAGYVLRREGHDFDSIRTSTFFGLILANLGLILLFTTESVVIRRPRVQPTHLLIFALVLIAGAAVWKLKVLRQLFGLVEPGAVPLRAAVFSAAAAVVLIYAWRVLSGLFRPPGRAGGV
jgi:hypothetical protein